MPDVSLPDPELLREKKPRNLDELLQSIPLAVPCLPPIPALNPQVTEAFTAVVRTIMPPGEDYINWSLELSRLRPNPEAVAAMRELERTITSLAERSAVRGLEQKRAYEEQRTRLLAFSEQLNHQAEEARRDLAEKIADAIVNRARRAEVEEGGEEELELPRSFQVEGFVRRREPA